MLPFERLRALARHAGDDRELVVETADCLAEFSFDPAQLVTSCRRLLAHHVTCGPLWWLCARVITASDPGEAAREAQRRLDADPTGDRLAAVLPFPHDDPIAVVGLPDSVAAALEQRPDLDALAIRGGPHDRELRSRVARSGATIRVVDETEAMALEPSHLLVGPLAASPTTALVPEGTAGLVWALGSARLWLVAEEGRVLPARLFDAMRHHVELDDAPVEVLEVSKAERVAGPAGLIDPARLAERADCPVAPELLRL